MHGSPVTSRVEGSPFQPGDRVVVVRICDEVGLEAGFGDFVGKSGAVEHLEYSCGCGQSYPDDPMVGVRLPGGELAEFWRDELKKE